MSRNGTGTYNLPAGNPVVTGTTISTTWANTTLTDIGTALTGSVASDGQTPMTGNLNLNSNTIVNLANPTANQDAVTKVYVDTNALLKASNLSDVANATTSRTNLSAAKSGANSDITSITGLTTPLTVAQGGIGAATLTANNVLLGNGTSAPQVVAPSTSGNVLTSNGTTWTSAAPAIGGIQTFTSTGTFTVPTGITTLTVYVQAGGGGGGGAVSGCGLQDFQGMGGGGGGGGLFFITGLTSGSTITATVGDAGTGGVGNNNGTSGGVSSFGSYISCTGGVGGSRCQGTSGTVYSTGAGGTCTTNGPLVYDGTVGGVGGFDAGSANNFGGKAGLYNNAFAPNKAWKTGNGNSATGFGNGGGGATINTGSGNGGNGTAGRITVVW
jgi:hypothetical protein